ncbi:hypothetical protein P3L10_030541 [Capsicum annuum]
MLCFKVFVCAKFREINGYGKKSPFFISSNEILVFDSCIFRQTIRAKCEDANSPKTPCSKVTTKRKTVKRYFGSLVAIGSATKPMSIEKGQGNSAEGNSKWIKVEDVRVSASTSFALVRKEWSSEH